jgi:hypothetical protein
VFGVYTASALIVNGSTANRDIVIGIRRRKDEIYGAKSVKTAEIGLIPMIPADERFTASASGEHLMRAFE